jgi:hypothetical protein
MTGIGPLRVEVQRNLMPVSVELPDLLPHFHRIRVAPLRLNPAELERLDEIDKLGIGLVKNLLQTAGGLVDKASQVAFPVAVDFVIYREYSVDHGSVVTGTSGSDRLVSFLSHLVPVL